jgi:hypothetical protein
MTFGERSRHDDLEYGRSGVYHRDAYRKNDILPMVGDFIDVPSVSENGEDTTRKVKITFVGDYTIDVDDDQDY